MKHLLIISLLLCCLSLKAQNDYHTIKGEIVSSDSLAPIPKAHILSELSHYGTTSDFDGKFSMPIKTIDTLRISSVGFVTEYIHINHDSIDANNFRILLQRDTIMLDEIDVIPYYNFSTVKEIVRTAPIVTPMHVVKEIEINTNIQNYYYNKTKDLPKTRGTWTIVFYNPIKKTYNRFNKKERLKRKLKRNREKYLMD
ncbi:MAG: carboxypeptidase-like regulatory domain-containing protein [Bacteroidales bacterium]|nr:carboxypeptidase-like regulatory domain-containing protein [Bacteroidales bacterium]